MSDRSIHLIGRSVVASFAGIISIAFILWLIDSDLRADASEDGGPTAVLQPVNDVVGDAGYAAVFGKLPDQSSSERLRIQTHLAFVEGQLRGRSMHHLTPEQARRRTEALDHLRSYRMVAEFPHNTTHAGRRTPVFIDEDGRICAVGYMVRQTAGAALAEAVDERYRYASIFEMDMPELERWADEYGFTTRELAMIQPEYCWRDPPGAGCVEEEPVSARTVEVATLGLNVSSALVNAWMAGRGQRNLFISGAGVLAGGAGLAVGLSGDADYRAATLATAGASVVLGGWNLLRRRAPDEDGGNRLAYVPEMSPVWSVDAAGEHVPGVKMTWQF